MAASSSITKSLAGMFLLGAIMLLGWVLVLLSIRTLFAMHSDPEVPWYFEGGLAALTVAMIALLVVLFAVLRREVRD